jgi:hypothetical protein
MAKANLQLPLAATLFTIKNYEEEYLRCTSKFSYTKWKNK